MTKSGRSDATDEKFVCNLVAAVCVAFTTCDHEPSPVARPQARKWPYIQSDERDCHWVYFPELVATPTQSPSSGR